MYIYVYIYISVYISVHLFIYIYVYTCAASRWMALGSVHPSCRSICAADGDTVVTRIRFDPTAAPAGPHSTRCEYSEYPV